MGDSIVFELGGGLKFRLRIADFVRAVDVGDPERCVVVYRSGSGEGSVIVRKGYEAVLAALGRSVKPVPAGPAVRPRFVRLGDRYVDPAAVQSVEPYKCRGSEECAVIVGGEKLYVRRRAADVVAELEAALAARA